MANYSITEARNQWYRLVKKALAGEDITITRRGKVMVHMTPVLDPFEPSKAERQGPPAKASES
jgi:prevent-host-death family protein